MHDPQAALVAHEQGHLLAGIHDALVLHDDPRKNGIATR